MRTEKNRYEDPKLSIILLDDEDVIATSGEQGSLDSWGGGSNVDADGWTQAQMR